MKQDFNLFYQELIKEINLVRKSPLEYTCKIDQHSNFITFKDGRYIYENGDNKFILNRGLPAFKDCINILTNIGEGISELKLSDRIKLEVPDNVEEHMKYESSFKALKECHQDKDIELNIDINYPIAEQIVILMLIDDNKFNGKRRNNLLSKQFKEVGMSMKKGRGRHYTIYLTFSN